MGHIMTAGSTQSTSVGEAVLSALDATALALFIAAVAGRAWLALDPAGYCRWRMPFAIANRSARSVFMLTHFFKARGAAGEGGAGPGGCAVCSGGRVAASAPELGCPDPSRPIPPPCAKHR
jgi:hypothetical protein